MPLTLAQLRAAVQALAEAGSTELKQQLGDPSLGGGQIIVIPPAGTRPRGEWWVFGSKWVDALLGGIADEVTTYVGGTTMDVNIIQVGGVAVPGDSVPIDDGGNSITVDGAVAVTQGTSPWVTADPVLDSTVIADTAIHPAKSVIVGGYVLGMAGKTARAIEIDPGNGQVACDSAHHEQHEGYAFKAFVKNLALANGANLDVLVNTGAASGRPHMTLSVESSSSCEWLLYEGTTTSNDGAAVVENNAFRDMAQVSTCVVTSGPTVTGVGTQIDGGTLGGGNGSGRVGSSTATRSEWILKTGVKYLLRVTNDASTNRVYVKFDWYSNHDANGGHVL